MKNIAILFIMALFGLSSCSRYKLVSAERTKVIPGVVKASPYFKFKIKVEVGKTDIKFNKVIVSSDKEIDRFSVKDLSTNIESSNSNSFGEGNYSLSFKLKEDEVFTESSEVILVLLIKGKEKRVKHTLEVTPDKRKR